MKQQGSSRGKTGEGIPKLQVQPGTPLPNSPRALPAIIPSSRTNTITPRTQQHQQQQQQPATQQQQVLTARLDTQHEEVNISTLQGNPNLAMGRFTRPLPPSSSSSSRNAGNTHFLILEQHPLLVNPYYVIL